jgi:hypothetical protein
MIWTREMARSEARCSPGYKVHFTQTCDEDAPQLITAVQTTAAPLSDEGVVGTIHADLAEKELLPDEHLVDSGYVTITNLVQSQSNYEVDLIGPTLKTHWYQAETGYDLSHFSIDWETETVTCPQGRINSSWTPMKTGRQIAHSGEILPDRLQGVSQPDLLHRNDPTHADLTRKGADASAFCGAPTRAHRCF